MYICLLLLGNGEHFSLIQVPKTLVYLEAEKPKSHKISFIHLFIYSSIQLSINQMDNTESELRKSQRIYTDIDSCHKGTVISVQSLSNIRLFATPWTAARQAFLSITNSQSLLKLMSFESVMPSNHLILCHPLLFSPSIFPSIRIFSNESALCIRWPKYWSFSFSISPSNEYSGLISFKID